MSTIKIMAGESFALEDPALDASIRHWWENVRLHDLGVEYGMHSEDCALCQMRQENGATECAMIDNPCPVYKVTECYGCGNTPWLWVVNKQVHPMVMAWWLEDLKAGRAVPFSPTSREALSLGEAFPY